MPTQTVIEALRVRGSGFLSGLTLTFAPGLNCIIGARGTGKTSVLEMIRFATGREGDRKNTEKIVGQLLVPAIGPDGIVEVDLTTPLGQRLTLIRPVSGRPYARDRESEENVEINWPPLGIHDLSIFSQNQLEDVAVDPSARLAMLDAFCGLPLAAKQDEIRALRQRLERLAQRYLQIANEVELLRANEELLPTRQGELAQAEAVHDAALKDLQAAQVDKETIADLARRRDSLRVETALLRRLLEEATASLAEPYPARGLASAAQDALEESRILNLPDVQELRSLRQVIADAGRRFSALREQMTVELTRVRDEVLNRLTVCEQTHAEASRSYHELEARLGQKSNTWKQAAAQRDKLAEEVSRLQVALADMNRLRQTMSQLIEERGALLTKFGAARHARFELRRQAQQRLNSDLSNAVRVAVSEGAALDTYIEFMTDALRGSSMWYTRLVEGIATRVPPDRLAQIICDDDSKALQRLSGLELSRARRVIRHLNDPAKRFALEALDIEDAVTFSLRVGDDSFQPTERLSQGQRCTTTLSLLLLDSGSPLLIDQPEDNLDNSYVVEGVVEVVQRQTSRRQFIFITHNPNIPVLAEADVVHHMTLENERAFPATSGPWCAPNVMHAILSVMEGGPAAFARRHQAYASGEQLVTGVAG